LESPAVETFLSEALDMPTEYHGRSAAAYLRASDEEQKLSPAVQRDVILSWAARENVQVTSWHEDLGTCSADPLETRPGLLSALSSVRKGGLLVVARRDRLARDVLISSLIEREVVRGGGSIVSASGEGNGDTPADQFMRTVVDGAAEYERALIRARTRGAMAALKAAGKSTGAVPYGFQVGEGGHLEKHAFESSTVERARTLYATEFSYRATAAALARDGRLSRAGKVFHPQQVKAMLGGDARRV
jgi:DNA invertase Pin-like site-specific DNA recombinase